LRDVTRQARSHLWLVPGNKRTATAQAILTFERAEIDTLARALTGRINGGPDYIILDTAPSVGGLQDMALWMADAVIIPTAVDFLASTGVAALVGSLKILKDKGWQGAILGILPTFHDDITNESKANLDELKGAFGDLILDPIHRATILRECAAEGKTVWEMAPKSRAADEYAALVWRVADV